MTLSEVAQHKGVRWGALVALLVGVTKFDEGLSLVWRKWNADVEAAEAKKMAQEVDSELDQFLVAQREALIAQEAYQQAQQEFANQLMQQQLPNPISATRTMRLWDAEEERWFCDNGVESWWEPKEGCL